MLWDMSVCKLTTAVCMYKRNKPQCPSLEKNGMSWSAKLEMFSLKNMFMALKCLRHLI